MRQKDKECDRKGLKERKPVGGSGMKGMQRGANCMRKSCHPALLWPRPDFYLRNRRASRGPKATNGAPSAGGEPGAINFPPTSAHAPNCTFLFSPWSRDCREPILTLPPYFPLLSFLHPSCLPYSIVLLHGEAWLGDDCNGSHIVSKRQGRLLSIHQFTKVHLSILLTYVCVFVDVFIHTRETLFLLSWWCNR